MDEAGDDADNVGHAGVCSAGGDDMGAGDIGASSTAVEDIGASGAAVEDVGTGGTGDDDDEDDLETLAAWISRRATAPCAPEGGKGTSLARRVVRQHSLDREERNVNAPPVPEPVREAQPGNDRMAGKVPMGAGLVPPGFGGVPRIRRVIRRDDE